MMQFFSFIASVLVQALFLSGDADSYGLVNKAVVVGSSVQFHCDVNSSDSLRVEFYKLGAILPEPELIWNFDSVGKTHFGSRLNVTVESCRQGPTCVIEIQNAQMNDAGSVVCRKVGQVAGYAASISVIGSELNCSTNETVCEDRMYNVSVSCELIYAGSFVPSVRCGVSGDLLITGTSTNVSYLDYNKTTASFFGIALALKVANKSRIKCQLNFSNDSQSVPFPPIRTHSHATNLPTYSSQWQSSTMLTVTARNSSTLSTAKETASASLTSSSGTPDRRVVDLLVIFIYLFIGLMAIILFALVAHVAATIIVYRSSRKKSTKPSSESEEQLLSLVRHNRIEMSTTNSQRPVQYSAVIPRNQRPRNAGQDPITDNDFNSKVNNNHISSAGVDTMKKESSFRNDDEVATVKSITTVRCTTTTTGGQLEDVDPTYSEATQAPDGATAVSATPVCDTPAEPAKSTVVETGVDEESDIPSHYDEITPFANAMNDGTQTSENDIDYCNISSSAAPADDVSDNNFIMETNCQLIDRC